MATDIKHKLIVLSGKGGVGKSSVAVNLAVWLSVHGQRTGLLDVDIHGPSVPKMLGIGDRTITAENDRVQPIDYSDHLKVMSIGFMLPNDDEALIWRGPMKHNLIQQFVEKGPAAPYRIHAMPLTREARERYGGRAGSQVVALTRQ